MPFDPERLYLVEPLMGGYRCTTGRNHFHHDREPLFVRAEWVIEWVKDRHLAWCRGEANEAALGFDDWIDQQWADATSRADGDER